MAIVKVKSTADITFPKLGWSISAGQIKDLPEGTEAQERILREPEISVVEADGSGQTAKTTKKKN